jgi:hypothetical protein
VPLWVANVELPWSQMGLATAGCGGRLRTEHPMLLYLYNAIGLHTAQVAWHQCARQLTWPEMDILRTMHNGYLNARDILNSSLVKDSEVRERPTVEGGQTLAFPAWVMPYYGPYMANPQIRLWLQHNLELLTYLITCDENRYRYGFAQGFLNAVAVPIRDNYQFMLLHLLKLDPTKITDDYIATEEDFAGYEATKNSMNYNVGQAAGAIDPGWHPTSQDRAWAMGAFTYSQLVPILDLWPESACAAPSTGTTASTGGSGGGIQTA